MRSVPVRWIKNVMGVIVIFTLVILVGVMMSNSANSGPLYPDAKLVLTKLCSDNSNSHVNVQPNVPIYFVTPTYSRREQMAELTRLSQTLLHIKNLVWIIAEDSETCSPLVKRVLGQSGLPYVHLASPMPSIYKKEYYKPRGVSSRNAALDWIEEHALTEVRSIRVKRKGHFVVFRLFNE